MTKCSNDKDKVPEEFHFLLSWTFCNKKEIKRKGSGFFQSPLHLKPHKCHLHPGSKGNFICLEGKLGLPSARFQTSFRATWTIALKPWYSKHTWCACTSPPMASTVNYGVLCGSRKAVPAQGCQNPEARLRGRAKLEQPTSWCHLHLTHTLGSTRQKVALPSCSFALVKSGNVRHLPLSTAHRWNRRPDMKCRLASPDLEGQELG